jgi:hypothetical protein
VALCRRSLESAVTFVRQPLDNRSCVGGEGAALANNLVDAVGWVSQLAASLLTAPAERLQILVAKDFGGMNERQRFRHLLGH